MFSRRPRRPSRPSSPAIVSSPSALIAAATVYHPSTPSTSSLAAAAASAALRNAAASPLPLEQRTGSIPTKRMLQRRDSYSSVTSDTPLQRRASAGSLTERRFRQDPESSRSVWSMREKMRRHSSTTASVRKGTPSMLPRGSLQGGEPSPVQRRRFSSSSESSDAALSPPPPPPTRKTLQSHGEQGGYADSVTSFVSDLDSIAEDEAAAARQRRGRRGRATPTPTPREEEEQEEEEEEEEEEYEMRSRERERTLLVLESQGPKETKRVIPSWSPTRPQFPGTMLEPVKHSPPARSISPAKSALKHPCAEKVPGDALSLTSSEGKRAHVRVSFSDEDSVASYTHVRPPAVALEDLEDRPELPIFAIVKGGDLERWSRRETAVMSGVVTRADSLSSDDEDMEKRRHGQLRTVPELVLIQPSPRNEKNGFDAIPTGQELQDPQKAADTPSSPPSLASGFIPARSPPGDPDSNSDSDGSSIYADALEVIPQGPSLVELRPLITATFPSPPPQSPASSTPHSTPSSPRQTNKKLPIPRPPSPPLPPSFSKPTPTPARRRSLTPPPRRRHTQRQQQQRQQPQERRQDSPDRRTVRKPHPANVLDDSSSEASVSSFRRSFPRASGSGSGGFRSTMRASGAPPPPPRQPRRFSVSSESSAEATGSGGGVRKRLGRGIRKVGGGSARKASGGSRSTSTAAPWRSRFEDSSESEDFPSVVEVKERSVIKKPGASASGGAAGENPAKLRKTPTVRRREEEADVEGTDKGLEAAGPAGSEVKEVRKNRLFGWGRKGKGEKGKRKGKGKGKEPVPEPPATEKETKPVIRSALPQQSLTPILAKKGIEIEKGKGKGKRESGLMGVAFAAEAKKKGWKRVFGGRR